MARLIDHRLAALMVVAFVSTLGEFLVVALLPFYAGRHGASPLQVGVLVSAFALAAMVSAPLWGRLADRSGRRPALLLGLIVSAAGYLLFGFAQSLETLLLARLLHGVGGGTVPVVFAYIADSVSGERRAEGIGWVTAVTSSAAMIGPAVGGIAGQFHPAGAGVLAAAFSLAAAAFAWFWLPETRSRDLLADGPKERHSILEAVGRVAARPIEPLNLLVWIYSAGQFGMAGMTAIIGLHLGWRFGVDESTIGLFFLYLGGLSIVFRVLVLGRAVRRFGETRVLQAGALSFGVGLVALPFATGLWTLGAAIFLVPLGTSLLFPCTTSLVSKRAPAGAVMGQVLGVQQAYGNASKIAAPFLAGYLFQAVSPRAPFMAIGLVMLAAAALSLRIHPQAEPGGREATES